MKRLRVSSYWSIFQAPVISERERGGGRELKKTFPKEHLPLIWILNWLKMIYCISVLSIKWWTSVEMDYLFWTMRSLSDEITSFSGAKFCVNNWQLIFPVVSLEQDSRYSNNRLWRLCCSNILSGMEQSTFGKSIRNSSLPGFGLQ